MMNNFRFSEQKTFDLHPGFVDAFSQQGFVNSVFDSVAEHYDLMNDLISLGLHRIWKQAMVTRLNPSCLRATRILDVAGGTGDIALRIVRASSKKAEVTIADINLAMLEAGRQRAEKEGFLPFIRLAQANAETLPFKDESFDACTIAFGIRNIPDRLKALKEILRVLKPGGRFLCLEFSQIEIPVLEKLYHMWSSKVIPEVARRIVGDCTPYDYLVESIRLFPERESFSRVLADAGFACIKCDPYAGGIAALHSCWKF